MKIKSSSQKRGAMARRNRAPVVHFKPPRSGRSAAATKSVVLVRNIPDVAPGAFSIRRILVPTDFSKCSRKAITYAVAFAQQFDATLILMHVMQAYFPVPELGAVDYGLVESQMRAAAEKELAVLRDDLISKNVAVETVIQVGVPFREIDQSARALDADLIIIPTHGRSGLQQVFMGGTAEQVVRYAPCPVLVVREHEHEFVRE